MRKFFLSLVAAAVAVVGSAAVAGTVIYEGGVAPEAGAPPPDITLGDFDGVLSDPTIAIMGDTSIWGGVAHRTSTLYTDAWTADFGTGLYQTVFNWQKTSANFDGQLVVNGVQHLLGASGSLDLGTLTGVVTFDLDPIFGVFGPDPDEVATWNIQHSVAPVPLPAAGWMLLAGVAGLGFAKRKRGGQS